MRWTDRVRRAFKFVLDPRTKYVHAWWEDPPDAPQAGYVYLIGDRQNPWSASFVCPCGCGELISLSLIKSDDPRWRHSIDGLGAISLHPSIWRTRGCRSHFFIRKGRVLWAYAVSDDRERQ